MREYFIHLKDGVLLIDIGVAPPQGYVTASKQPATYLAVIDTGANMSVISPRVVKELRPPEFGMETVMLPGLGYALEPTYYVRFRIGGHQAESEWHPLLVTGTEPATPDADVIIGMDVLAGLDWGWRGSTGLGSILC
jgi:predicted aspartyl protease